MALDCTHYSRPAVILIHQSCRLDSRLSLARASDGRGVLVFDSTSVASAGLDGTDDAH
jgi:hypothetical protein